MERPRIYTIFNGNTRHFNPGMFFYPFWVENIKTNRIVSISNGPEAILNRYFYNFFLGTIWSQWRTEVFCEHMQLTKVARPPIH